MASPPMNETKEASSEEQLSDILSEHVQINTKKMQTMLVEHRKQVIKHEPTKMYDGKCLL